MNEYRIGKPNQVNRTWDEVKDTLKPADVQAIEKLNEEHEAQPDAAKAGNPGV